MTSQQQTPQEGVSASWPAPPKWYKMYGMGESGPEPPRPPESGTSYSAFGDTFSTSYTLPTLEEQGKEQLYPVTGDAVMELRRIVRSLGFNYLQLLDTLVSNPTAAAQKISDIELLFVNAHHLVNAHRPAQAREELIKILQEQNERKKALIAATETSIAEARTSLREGVEQIAKQTAKLSSVVSQISSSSSVPAVVPMIIDSETPLREKLAAIPVPMK